MGWLRLPSSAGLARDVCQVPGGRRPAGRAGPQTEAAAASAWLPAASAHHIRRLHNAPAPGRTAATQNCALALAARDGTSSSAGLIKMSHRAVMVKAVKWSDVKCYILKKVFCGVICSSH